MLSTCWMVHTGRRLSGAGQVNLGSGRGTATCEGEGSALAEAGVSPGCGGCSELPVLVQ